MMKHTPNVHYFRDGGFSLSEFCNRSVLLACPIQCEGSKARLKNLAIIRS